MSSHTGTSSKRDVHAVRHCTAHNQPVTLYRHSSQDDPLPIMLLCQHTIGMDEGFQCEHDCVYQLPFQIHGFVATKNRPSLWNRDKTVRIDIVQRFNSGRGGSLVDYAPAVDTIGESVRKALAAIISTRSHRFGAPGISMHGAHYIGDQIVIDVLRPYVSLFALPLLPLRLRARIGRTETIALTDKQSGDLVEIISGWRRKSLLHRVVRFFLGSNAVAFAVALVGFGVGLLLGMSTSFIVAPVSALLGCGIFNILFVKCVRGVVENP